MNSCTDNLILPAMESAMPVSPSYQELRIDPGDGQAYSREQFNAYWSQWYESNDIDLYWSCCTPRAGQDGTADSVVSMTDESVIRYSPCVLVPVNSEPTQWSVIGAVHGASDSSPSGQTTCCEQPSASDGESTSASSHGGAAQHRCNPQRKPQRQRQRRPHPQHDNAVHQCSSHHSGPQPKRANAASNANNDKYDELMGSLKEEGDAKQRALLAVQSQMFALSFDSAGCWVAEEALGAAETKQAVEMV